MYMCFKNSKIREGMLVTLLSNEFHSEIVLETKDSKKELV